MVSSVLLFFALDFLIICTREQITRPIISMHTSDIQYGSVNVEVSYICARLGVF